MLRISLLAILTALAFVAAPVRAAAQTTQPGGCSIKWAVASKDLVTINENHYRLLKDVQVDCNDVQLFADEMEIFSDADRVRASGNVVFVSGTSRISAERMEFNTRTKTGTFFVASGIANLENRGIDRSLFGTQEPDAYFWGETVEKLGPKTYRVTHGGFTTCVQPTPRWEMVATSVTLTLEKRAVLTNMVLKVKNVPVFYLPGMYYPINKEDRATGFLLPIYGSSSIKGQTINNAFFWAINRSQDATLYYSFYSKTGQSFGGQYRYIQSPGSSGQLETVVVREHDAIYRQPDGTDRTTQGIDSYTITGTILQQLPARLRLSGTANYFSSLIAQQRYQQGIYAATNRTRNFGVNLSGNWGANSISGAIDRNETFTTDTESQVFGTSPRITYSRGEQRLGPLPLYAGTTAEYVTLVRHGRSGTQTSDTGLTRIDASPSLRFPFTKWQFLTFNSSLGFRETYWTESLVDGKQAPETIHREYMTMRSAVTGPVLTKIFNTPGSTYAQKFKHVIEPTVTFSHTTAVDNNALIVKNDGLDYVIGDTSVTYGLSNRLYAKKVTSREILSVSLQQTYHTNQNSADVDAQYQSSTYSGLRPPSHMSPLALQVHTSPTTVTDATVRAEFDTQAHALSAVTASGGLTQGWVSTSAGWSLNRSIPQKIGDPVTTSSHSLYAATSIRKPGNGFGGSYAFNYDVKTTSFINQTIIAHYNTQCCGLAVEYQKFNFGTRAGAVGVPKDHRFNLSFTLAGIGTFSDLFGAFGGQQGR